MNFPDPALQDESVEINLASMLDIVFIMLIFFVVTATFTKETGVDVTLPLGIIDMPSELESITVTVEGRGIFVVNGRVVTADSLRAYVAALHAENPGANYAVLVTDGSRVRDAVKAVDAGRMIGWDVVPVSPAP